MTVIAMIALYPSKHESLICSRQFFLKYNDFHRFSIMGSVPVDLASPSLLIKLGNSADLSHGKSSLIYLLKIPKFKNVCCNVYVALLRNGTCADPEGGMGQKPPTCKLTKL